MRIAAAVFWVFAGAMHFVIPRQYEAIVPPRLARWKKELVVVSGVAEIAGGIAVLPDQTRRGARWWLLATLLAVYPANIHMAVNSKEFPKIPAAALWARLPVQGLFALLTWRGTRYTLNGVRPLESRALRGSDPGRRPGSRAESHLLVIVLGIDPGTAQHGLRRGALARDARLPRSTAA